MFIDLGRSLYNVPKICFLQKRKEKKDQIVVNETNMSIISKGQEYILAPTQPLFFNLACALVQI